MVLQTTLQVLSMMAVIVPIPPTVWHIKSNNWPAVCLLTYLYILNINTFIGATIWRKNLDTAYQGEIYCDIMIHFLCASSLGVVCPIVAILRNLAAIMSKEGPSPIFKQTASGKTVLNKRRLYIDLAISLAFPIYSMSVLFIVQYSRYVLSEYTGCLYLVSSSWVSILLLFVWPPIMSLFGTLYACVIIYRYLQRRRDFKDLLHCSGSGLTTTRFVRLVIFSAVVIAIMLPITIIVLYLNTFNGRTGFKWSDVHNSSWNKIQYFRNSGVYFDRWIFITIAFLSFILFGTGSDALNMYYEWFDIIGLFTLVERVGASKVGQKGSNLLQKFKAPFFKTKASSLDTLKPNKCSSSTSDCSSDISHPGQTRYLDSYPLSGTTVTSSLKSPGNSSLNSIKRYEPTILVRSRSDSSEDNNHRPVDIVGIIRSSPPAKTQTRPDDNTNANTKRYAIPAPLVTKSILYKTATATNNNNNSDRYSPSLPGQTVSSAELPMNFVTPVRSTFTPTEIQIYGANQDNISWDDNNDNDDPGVFWARYREKYVNELPREPSVNSRGQFTNSGMMNSTSDDDEEGHHPIRESRSNTAVTSNIELDDLHPDLWHYKMVVTRNESRGRPLP